MVISSDEQDDEEDFALKSSEWGAIEVGALWGHDCLEELERLRAKSKKCVTSAFF